MHKLFSHKGNIPKEHRLIQRGAGPESGPRPENSAENDPKNIPENKKTRDTTELQELIAYSIELSDEVADLLVERVMDLADKNMNEAGKASFEINNQLLAGVETSQIIFVQLQNDQISNWKESDQQFQEMYAGSDNFDEIDENLATVRATGRASTKVFDQFMDRGKALDHILEKQEDTGSSETWQKTGGGSNPKLKNKAGDSGMDNSIEGDSITAEQQNSLPKLLSNSPQWLKKAHNDVVDQVNKGELDPSEASDAIAKQCCKIFGISTNNTDLVKNIIQSKDAIAFLKDLPPQAMNNPNYGSTILAMIESSQTLTTPEKEDLYKIVGVMFSDTIS